jgi:spore germination protein KC
MKRACCFLLMLLFALTVLSACYDSREIDNWAYVYSVGVDKGVSDKLRFSVQTPKLKGQSGSIGSVESSGGKGTETDFTVISVDCPTFLSGVEMMETSLSRKFNFMHTKYLIVSEDFAKEGVETFVNGMRRERQVRRIMSFIVVEGEASKFVQQLNPILGATLSKFMEGMMAMGNHTGLFYDFSYGDFTNEMKSTRGQPACVLAGINDFSGYLPQGTETKETSGSIDYYAGEVPRAGGNRFEFLGTALFNGDKMVGKLNGEETRAMLMAKGEFNRASVTIRDPLRPEFFVTADVRAQKKPKVKVSIDEGKPVIQLEVFLEGDLRHVQSGINYESEDLIPVLERSFEASIKEKLDNTIEKCKGLSCDVFGFGEKASMKFLTIQEWENYNWNKQFKYAQVTTKVEFIMRRPGTILRTNPTVRSED